MSRQEFSFALSVAALVFVNALAGGVAAAQSPRSGPEFHVNTPTTGDQTTPGVSINPLNGTFVVVWRDAASQACRAQRYDASGIPLGGNFTGLGFCSSPGSVAALSTGDLVFFGQEDATNEVYGNAFSS